ncbi:MAG: response regulator [Nitrospirae bacterium]|nr:response regulator [Nitrospirota bacterium]
MSKKVLVVEDSAAMRSLIASTVEELTGYETVEAGNGFEALKALPAHRFDLIITDINMPDINGLEIIHFVKGNAAYKEIPLIVVTTEQGEADRQKGLALGAAEYITKPFDPEKLKAVVKRITRG